MTEKKTRKPKVEETSVNDVPEPKVKKTRVKTVQKEKETKPVEEPKPKEITLKDMDKFTVQLARQIETTLKKGFERRKRDYTPGHTTFTQSELVAMSNLDNKKADQFLRELERFGLVKTTSSTTKGGFKLIRFTLKFDKLDRLAVLTERAMLLQKNIDILQGQFNFIDALTTIINETETK